MKIDPPDSDRMSLTQPQMRALLDLALDAQMSTSDAFGRRMEAQSALDELGARAGASTAGMLDRVAEDALSIPELQTVKELAKCLIADANATPREREAAQLLYHASTAAALCVNGTKISGEPIQDCREAYLRLSAVFPGEPLGDLFARAAAWTVLLNQNR